MYQRLTGSRAFGHWPKPSLPNLCSAHRALDVSLQPSVPEICVVTVMSGSRRILGQGLVLGTVVLLHFGQLVKGTEDLTRNVSSTFNEGCNIPFCKNSNNGSCVNVFHISARGQNDTIHFVWSSYGALTGLVAQTKNTAVFRIDWEKVKNRSLNAISFEPKGAVLFSSGVIFSRLIEFDDVSDTAKLTPASKIKVKSFEDLQWNNFNMTVSKTKHSGVFNSSSLAKGGNGFISLMVQGFQDNGRGKVLPQLLHTSNSSYFEFALKNISTHFNNSRFALELVFVHQDKKNKTSFSISRSIADQYTPAVFYVDNVKFTPSSKDNLGGYVSWKPVTYTKEERHLGNGKLVHQYGLKTNVTQLWDHLPLYSIAHAFWGDLKDLDITSMNISFGIDQDGFYKETNYTVWCGLVGYGEAPLDGLSLLIIIVISASIGIPVVLIVFGGSFMSFRNLLRKKKGEALLVDPGIN